MLEEDGMCVLVGAGTSVVTFLKSVTGVAKSNLLTSCLGVKLTVDRCDGVKT